MTITPFTKLGLLGAAGSLAAIGTAVAAMVGAAHLAGVDLNSLSMASPVTVSLLFIGMCGYLAGTAAGALLDWALSSPRKRLLEAIDRDPVAAEYWAARQALAMDPVNLGLTGTVEEDSPEGRANQAAQDRLVRAEAAYRKQAQR